jgi:adenylosuccinate lyase
MPNKRNPEPAERVQGLADLARGHADTMLSLRTADHRDSTRIPVLYTAVPGAFLLVSRALETIAGHLETMLVNREVMRANLDHPNVLGQAAAERVMIALYRKTGRKHWAHTRLSECSAISTRTRRPLRQVIEEMADLTAHLSAAELDLLFELSTYTGTAALQVEQAVARIMERSGAARESRGATTA